MAAGKTEESTDSTCQKTISRPNNLCCYSQRVCNLEKLKGFDFCHKHILEDKASPFKPCDFYAKSNERRCMNPAPKLQDKEKSYCIIHTRKSELRRAVEKRRKKRRRDSSTVVEEDEEESSTEKRRRTSSTASQKSADGSQKDEECHSSDDDLGMDLGIGGSLKVDSAWHGDVDSDAESIDSEEEDVLRHAGVWTLDEASKICYEKMVRLKALYAAQYKRLFHVLKEKRRKYLQVLQAEQENESVDSHLSPSEVLRSPAHHKRHGVEAILHKQAKEKRHGGSTRHQNTSHQRCTHVGDGVRCPNRILPLTKYCIHHISHDPNQLLFQSCSFKTGDQKTCNNMVPKIYPFSTCQLHITLPAEANRTDVKKDLDEAKNRDEEKKASENKKRIEAVGSVIINTIPPLPQVTDKQLPIPKALQQKSSALIPPPAQVTKETTSSQETPPTIKVSSSAPLPPKPPALKIEKTVLDSLGVEGASAKSRASSGSTPMEVLSPASADSPAGVQNISPTLLAASLAAVCSDAPIATVTSPIATTASPSNPVSTTSSDSTTTPVSTVSAPVASSTTTSSTSTISTSSTPNDPSTIITSAPSGLMSANPSDNKTPKDTSIPFSTPETPTKNDVQASSISGDAKSRDDSEDSESQKPAITSSSSFVSDSQGSSITTSTPNTKPNSGTSNIATTLSNTSEVADNTKALSTSKTSDDTSHTLSTCESEASSMKTDSLGTDSVNTEPMETDSMEKTATASVTSTAEDSVADQNTTSDFIASSTASSSVSTASSGSVSEPVSEITPMDTQSVEMSDSNKLSSNN